MRAAAVLLAGAVVLAGCSSTREKAKAFAEGGNEAFEAKGLSVDAVNRDVKVVSRTLLTDPNGTAIVVALRNSSPRALRDVPVSVTVDDRRGKAVYRNDAPGLEKGLVSAPLIAPDSTYLWVNDQVQASGEPSKVVARVGRAKAGTRQPDLPISDTRLEGDPTSGVAAVGDIRNTTRVLQTNVIVSAVARRGGEVVAAGRGIVPKLAAGKRARFHVFFIGNPRGARLALAAPPTVPVP